MKSCTDRRRWVPGSAAEEDAGRGGRGWEGSPVGREGKHLPCLPSPRFSGLAALKRPLLPATSPAAPHPPGSRLPWIGRLFPPRLVPAAMGILWALAGHPFLRRLNPKQQLRSREGLGTGPSDRAISQVGSQRPELVQVTPPSPCRPACPVGSTASATQITAWVSSWAPCL